MKITTDLHATKKGVITVVVDDDVWRELPTAVYGRKPEFPKECMSLDDFEETFADIEYRYAFQYALNLLAKAMNPTKKLSQKLMIKGISPMAIERVVSRCQEKRFLDDRAWAEATVRSEMRKKNGPQRIMEKLLTNGIEKSVAEEALESEYSGSSGAIRKLLQTKYRSHDIASYEGRAAVVASLTRKGFSRDDIERAIRS